MPRRIASLDGVRALAALSVFTFHVWLYRGDASPAGTGFWHSMAYELRLGLIVFFVLSGFLLWRDVAAMDDVRAYARRRARRILPAYYVAMIAAWLIVEWAKHTPGARPVDGAHVCLFAVFGQNYSPATIFKLNPVTWTLCIEVAFYVLVPLLALLRRPNPVVVGIALIAVGVVWNVFAQSPVALKALPAYLPYFGIGFIATTLPSRRWMVPAGFALIAANAAWHASHDAPRVIEIVRDVPAGAGAALLLAGVKEARWLGARPLAALGLVSYGFFLWQLPLILLLKRAGAFPDAFVPAFAVAFAALLVVAGASRRWLERPLLQRSGRATVAR
ncbi:MAG: acyltransferase family protein [Thermoleophilaceae bacterium]